MPSVYEAPIWLSSKDDPGDPNGSGNLVRIARCAIFNKRRSELAGHACYDDKDMIFIQGPGMDKQIGAFEIKADPTNQYYRRYQRLYDEFRAGGEGIEYGTSLSDLPFLTPAQQAELRGLKIFSAEQLASINDNTLRSLGPIVMEWRDKAKAHLDRTKGEKPFLELKAENAALQEQMAAMKKNMDDMIAKMAQPPAPQPQPKPKLTLNPAGGAAA